MLNRLINEMRVDAYTIPTDGPEADGTIEWNNTTIVIVRLKCGKFSSLGYTYAHPTAADLIRQTLFPILKQCDPIDIQNIWNQMLRAVRNFGRQGIAASAISAVDIALWDLKAKILDLPIVNLWGQVRKSIPIYGSGGFTSYSRYRLQEQLSAWREQGIYMMKIKVGSHPLEDVERVAWARDAIGSDAALFVDANGAYTRRQALMMMEQFREFGIAWLEEPVPSDDLSGLFWLKDHMPGSVQIAAGEYGYECVYFKNMLCAQATDVLQADATRCLGFTGFLQASALCEAFMHPLSAHTAPSLHVHLTCASTRAIHLEYFYDHVRIENLFFDGCLQAKNGALTPDLTMSGLGLKLKEQDISRYLVNGDKSV